MHVRVVSFARIREILDEDGSQVYELNDGTTIGAVWEALRAAHPALEPLARATRFARNGALVAGDTALVDGDELALLPPVGGG